MAKKEKHIVFGYKTKDGKCWLGFKPNVSKEELAAKYTEVSEQEWQEHLASLHHEPTAEQKAKAETKRRIGELKRFLNETDWVVIKIAEETDATKIAALREKYASVIADRISIRAEINELEEQL